MCINERLTYPSVTSVVRIARMTGLPRRLLRSREMHITGEESMENRRRERNEEQIRKWIEVVLPKCERATAGHVNLEEIKANGERPSSKPPIPDHALDLLEHEDNRYAAKCINPALQWLAENQGHLHFVTRLVMQEPALPRKWAEDSAEAGLYRKAVTKLEEYVEWRFPGERLRVAVDPKDEPVESRREAAYTDRRLTTADTDRRIVEELEEVEERTGLPRERAKLQLVAERDQTDNPIGMDRIRRAIQRMNDNEKAS